MLIIQTFSLTKIWKLLTVALLHNEKVQFSKPGSIFGAFFLVDYYDLLILIPFYKKKSKYYSTPGVRGGACCCKGIPTKTKKSMKVSSVIFVMTVYKEYNLILKKKHFPTVINNNM